MVAARHPLPDLEQLDPAALKTLILAQPGARHCAKVLPEKSENEAMTRIASRRSSILISLGNGRKRLKREERRGLRAAMEPFLRSARRKRRHYRMEEYRNQLMNSTRLLREEKGTPNERTRNDAETEVRFSEVRATGGRLPPINLRCFCLPFDICYSRSKVEPLSLISSFLPSPLFV
jgi:hypothetical protein